jgi:aspartokinase
VAELFAALDESGLTPGLIAADGSKVSAVVDPGPGLPGALDRLGSEVSLARDLAVVALVGEGIGREPGVARRALERLHRAGVAIENAFLGRRDASQSLLVAKADLAPAVRCLHAGLVSGALGVAEGL